MALRKPTLVGSDGVVIREDDLANAHSFTVTAPAGKVPALLRAAADRIEQLERELGGDAALQGLTVQYEWVDSADLLAAYDLVVTLEVC